MDKQTALKKYLKQLYHAEKFVISTVEELKTLRSSAAYQYSSGLIQTRVSSSHDTDPHYVKSVNKMIDLEAYLISELEKHVDQMKDIHVLLMQLPDNTMILVMKYRYIHFMKWELVAKKMGLSLKQVHRLHNDSLTFLSKIWEPGTAA